MKYYSFRIHEQNGEQEYLHECVTKAKSLRDAAKKAEFTAQTWYNDDDIEIPPDNCFEREYHFFGGQLVTRVESIRKTTKKEWLQEIYMMLRIM